MMRLLKAAIVLSIAGTIAMTETPAAAPSGADRQQITAVLNRAVEAEESHDIVDLREQGWPGARFSVRNASQRVPSEHAWDEPVWSQVYHRLRLGRPRIAVNGTRATAIVSGRGQSADAYDNSAFTQPGNRFSTRDRVVLERRRGVWRIMRWDRAVLR